MCEFCKIPTGIGNEIDAKSANWFLVKTNGECRIYCRRRHFSDAFGIPILFCPMCGRRLGELED